MPATAATAAVSVTSTDGNTPTATSATTAAAAGGAAASSTANSNSPVSSGRHQLRPVKYDYADSFACTYVVSVVAASIAELATYPLDLTKTRLQIQGEAASVVTAGKTNVSHFWHFRINYYRCWDGLMHASYVPGI